MSDLMPADEDEQSFERDQVIKIINSVIEKVEHAEDESASVIYQELRELQNIIEEARSAIGATRPDDIKDKHIPIATDELDAVVESTAEATGAIMDAAEFIMEKAGEVGGEQGDAITNEVMKIFEACSFQDITGQRITNVVKTLKEIESKVSKMIAIISSRLPGIKRDGDDDGIGGAEVDTKPEDDLLLNGPQMPDKAITQDDIDKLLSDF